MAEYITREAAKKACAESETIPRYSENNCPVTNKILDSIPAVSVPQWISVKDGMPENEKQVILLRRNGKVSRAEVRKIGETVRFRLYSEGDDYSPVTHWAAFHAMPLPEPPKGDADNG